MGKERGVSPLTCLQGGHILNLCHGGFQIPNHLFGEVEMRM